MPGFTLVHRTDAPVAEQSVRASLAATSDAKVGPDLSHDLLYTSRHTILAVSHYPGYPWRWTETERFQIALEGHIYDLDGSVAQSLPPVADQLFGAASFSRAAGAWLPTVDGDFVLWLREKASGRMVLLNDMLGRLPLYASLVPSQPGETVVSRSVQTVAHWTGAHRPDRNAMAEMLLFGYPLATHTLFGGVRRLAPATTVQPREHAAMSVSDPVQRMTPSTRRSCEAHAHLLADRFRCACARRATTDAQALLGLSGGLDSRAVLAGLARSSDTDSVHPITFARPDGSNAEDVAYAESLADLFGVPWSSFLLPSSSEEARRALLHLKGGLNSLEYSFMIDVLRHLRSTFGNGAILFTGDGGDKMLPDLRPAPRLPDAYAFLGHLLRVQGQMSLETVAAVVGLQRDDLADHLLSRVGTYATSTWADRYVEFILRERALSGFVEGEDRNRHFLWHTAPFYAWPVVSLALKIPFTQKSHDRLYSAFLRVLAPETQSVPRPDHVHTKPGSPFYHLFVRLRHTVHRFPFLQTSLRSLFRNRDPTRADAEVAARIRTQVRRTPALRTFLSASALDQLLDGDRPSSRGGLYAVLTLTSFLETYVCE